MYRKDPWSQARHDKEQRNAIIEECVRALEEYRHHHMAWAGDKGWFTEAIASIRTLKEGPCPR